MTTKAGTTNTARKRKSQTQGKAASKPTGKKSPPVAKENRTVAAGRTKKKQSSRRAVGDKASDATRGRGRPTVLSDDLVDEICDRLAAGESLEGICKSRHVPNSSTIRRWLARGMDDTPDPAFEEFCTRYARAREAQADALADEILDEARAATDKNANAKRVLIDALKWRAGKLKPKVYGNRVDHSHGGTDGRPIAIASASAKIDITDPDVAEAAKRYKEFLDAVD